MKYKIIYSTCCSIREWKVERSFRYYDREYVVISKSNNKYLCYKSQSGMLWHLYKQEGPLIKKFSSCGLYSTSLLLDLNLQRTLCNEKINDTNGCFCIDIYCKCSS